MEPSLAEPVHAVRLRTEGEPTVIEEFVLAGDASGARWLSDNIALGGFRVRRVATTLEQAMHPAPRREVGVILDGKLEVEVSSGDRRQFGPGSLVFLEDTSGTGHIPRVLEAATYLELHLTT